MGVALDPGFHSNGRPVHLLHDRQRRARRPLAGHRRLGRHRQPAPIVTGIPRTSGRHSGCRTRFGPDGNLWITTGDAADSNNPQNLRVAGRQGAARRPPAATAVAGNMVDDGVRSADLRLRLPQPAGHQLPAERRRGRSSSSTVRIGTTRSRWCTAGGNGGWAPGPRLQRERPDDQHRPAPTCCSRCGSRVPDHRSVRLRRSSPTPTGVTARGQLAVAVLKGEHLRMFNVDRRRAGPRRGGAHRLRPACASPSRAPTAGSTSSPTPTRAESWRSNRSCSRSIWARSFPSADLGRIFPDTATICTQIG